MNRYTQAHDILKASNPKAVAGLNDLRSKFWYQKHHTSPGIELAAELKTLSGRPGQPYHPSTHEHNYDTMDKVYYRSKNK